VTFAHEADSRSASLNDLGIALRQQGRHAEALDVLLQGLEAARALGDPRAVACPLLNIARTLAELGDPAEAIPRCQEVLVLAAAGAGRAIECSAHVQLGEALLALGRHAEALRELHCAWQIAEESGNAAELALAMRALGAVHQSLGAFATADERLHGALAIARREGDAELVCDVLRLLGRNDLLQGRPNDAVRLLDEALQVALRRGAPLLAAPVHELLAQAHEAAGDLAEALANLREFQRCRDAVQGQATLRRVHALLWRQQLAGLEREAQSQRDLAQSLAEALAATRQAEQEKAALLAEVAAQAEVLQQLAREDGLTLLANRRWFDTQWPKELERARRHAHDVAVAMVDVDDFKRVNDGFGHIVGDEVLRHVARVLRENCRSNDLVARYGGEEFVLMFVETGLAGARVTCEKLRGLVQDIDWGTVHEGLPPVTVSIGLACWTPQGATRDVLGAADEALYRAKEQGKNRVCTSSS
jgi:diguanylate cyclase (GGDEF)-like protein